MLRISIPLPAGRRHPDDRDAWFLESLAERIEEGLSSSGGGHVVDLLNGGPEVTICVLGGDPAEQAEALRPLLRRHCPRGTRVAVSGDVGAVDAGAALFARGEAAPEEPLPVAREDLRWAPFAFPSPPPSAALGEADAEVLRAIATSPGLLRADLSAAVDVLEIGWPSEDEVLEGLQRLLDAGYVVVRDGRLHPSDALARRLPRTATGRISAWREDAWATVARALAHG